MTPRMLLQREAARYCGLSVPAFEREIAAGRLPLPVMLGKKEHWCIKALDKALDALTGQGDLPLYRKKLYERFGPQTSPA